MEKNIVFKSKTFGGFDKKQVMDYINVILAENKELKEKLDELNKDVADAKAKAQEYKIKGDEAEQLKDILSVADEKITELEEQLLVKNTDFENAQLKIASKENEINELKVQLDSVVISDDVKNELEALRQENTILKSENEKKKDMERQLGAAMLDARMHSQTLVDDAKIKAHAVAKSVYSAIGETALKIDDLSGGIGEIARSFTKSVEEVELRIKALTGDMSKTAQLLISESGSLTGVEDDYPIQVEYDFTTVKNDGPITINPDDYNIEPGVDYSGKDYDTEE